VRQNPGHPGAELGRLIGRIWVLRDDAVDDALPEQVHGAHSLRGGQLGSVFGVAVEDR